MAAETTKDKVEKLEKKVLDGVTIAGIGGILLAIGGVMVALGLKQFMETKKQLII